MQKYRVTEAAATKRARATMVFMVLVWTTQRAVTIESDGDLFIPASPFANRDNKSSNVVKGPHYDRRYVG